MKTIFFRSVAAVVSAALAVQALAQTEPIISVDVTDITVLSGQGSVLTIGVTSGGSGYLTAPAVTISGGGGSGAAAVATVANGMVTSINVTNFGSGYTSAPTVTIAPPTAASTAAATATIAGGAITAVNLTSGGAGYTVAPTVTVTGAATTQASITANIENGVVTGFNILNPGAGYAAAPTITISAPVPGTQATASVTGMGTPHGVPNESYGPYGTPIAITALGKGTYTRDSFTYSFFVNGGSIGKTPSAVLPPTPVTANWTPPQPGAYFITVQISDGVHTATSVPIRYFATGTAVIGPADNTIVPIGSSVVLQATAVPEPNGGNAFVQRMEFFIDGQLRGTDYTYPYSLIYTPESSPTNHTVEARAYDNNGNQISANGTAVRQLRMTNPIGTTPTVRILDPLNNSSISAGATVNILADAAAPTGFIKNVDFYVNGVQLATSHTFPFKSSWTSQVPGRYEFVAIAFDDKSNAVASSPITINVTGGFPTIAITNPPAVGTTVIQGSTLSVGVTAAGADGGIASLATIELLVDGNVYDSLPKNPMGIVPPPPLAEPFVFTWRSNVAVGTHRLAARVTDNKGLKITSAEVPVIVVQNQLPTISLLAPESGSSFNVNTPVTISVNPSDPDGSVDSVEFMVNGTTVGSPVTKAPWQFTWTPSNPGPYTLSAKVKDNSGASVTSASVDVSVTQSSSGGGSTNTVFRGDYGSPDESGRFAFGVNRQGRGTFIAYSTNPTGHTYYYSDIPISTDGTFSVSQNNQVVLSGQTSATGVSGTFGERTFIGMITLGASSPIVMNGGITGTSGSTVAALVGADGTITLYSAAGGNQDAGSGTVSTSGAYTVKTPAGSTFSGNVVASSSQVSGSATGRVTGSYLLQQAAGRLVNLSTRAISGSGERTLIVGFVVRGTGAKPLLVRAVGPTLANFGVPNPLENPALSVVGTNNAAIASNDDWNNSAAVAALAQQVSAFPLNPNSKDAALQSSVNPGGYTVVVSGSGATGSALAEIYDADVANSPGARLTNLSSRALLGSNEILTAGFAIGGDKTKKLLIRAVGPTLSSFGIAAPFEDPKLQVLSGETVLASNDNWGTGAVSSINAATTSVLTFPLLSGSKDAALIAQLSPGTYTVQVTGQTSGSGVVLIEIYDLD